MLTFLKITLYAVVAVIWAASLLAQEGSTMSVTVPPCLDVGTLAEVERSDIPCFEIVPVLGATSESAGATMDSQAISDDALLGFSSIAIAPTETDQVAITAQITAAEPLVESAWVAEEIAMVEIVAVLILNPTDGEPVRAAVDEEPIQVPRAPDPAPPPVQPALQPTLAEALESGRTVSFNTILFNHDSAELKPESEPALAVIAEALQASPGLRVVIEGHTDSAGSEAYNLALSQRRAEAVMAALVERYDVDASRLKAVGRGETSPIASNSSAAGKTRNRRVEISRQDEKR